MSSKMTGEGIVQTLQLANLARAFLSGPSGMVRRMATREAANLAGIDLGLVNTFAKFQITSPAGIIQTAAGFLFGEKQKRPLIAHLTPHQIIHELHKREAIRLFLLPDAAFASAVADLEQNMGRFRCIPDGAISSVEQPYTGYVDKKRISGLWMTGKGVVSRIDAKLRPVTEAARGAWAPEADKAVLSSMKSTYLVKFEGYPHFQRMVDPCANRSVVNNWRKFVERFYTVESGTTSRFNSEAWTKWAIANENCPDAKLVGLGIDYLCAWHQSWWAERLAGGRPPLLRRYREELGDWLLTKVYSNPSYKSLIDRLVEIEEQREAARRSTASRFVDLIYNPTLGAFRSFKPDPIQPALLPLSAITPASEEQVALEQSITLSRKTADESVNIIQRIFDSADAQVRAQVEPLLRVALDSQQRAISAVDARTASSAAMTAKNAASQAVSIVTPFSEKLKGLLDPAVLIPVGILAAVVLVTSGSGNRRS
jgi:hypothetical protein